MNTLTREQIEVMRLWIRQYYVSAGHERSAHFGDALCNMALRACDAPEVAKDAERYRWLRRSELISFHHKKLWFEGVSNLDAAIDAALNAREGKT